MIESIGEAARRASRIQATAPTGLKDDALERAAARLEAESERLIETNVGDIEEAKAQGIGGALLDRLRLSPARVSGMAKGLRQVAALADPVGQITAGFVRPNGLRMTRFAHHLVSSR